MEQDNAYMRHPVYTFALLPLVTLQSGRSMYIMTPRLYEASCLQFCIAPLGHIAVWTFELLWFESLDATIHDAENMNGDC